MSRFLIFWNIFKAKAVFVSMTYPAQVWCSEVKKMRAESVETNHSLKRVTRTPLRTAIIPNLDAELGGVFNIPTPALAWLLPSVLPQSTGF